MWIGRTLTRPKFNDFLKNWDDVKVAYFEDPLHSLHFLQWADFQPDIQGKYTVSLGLIKVEVRGFEPRTPCMPCPHGMYVCIQGCSNSFALLAGKFTVMRHRATKFTVVADTVADMVPDVGVPTRLTSCDCGENVKRLNDLHRFRSSISPGPRRNLRQPSKSNLYLSFDQSFRKGSVDVVRLSSPRVNSKENMCRIFMVEQIDFDILS